MLIILNTFLWKLGIHKLLSSEPCSGNHLHSIFFPAVLAKKKKNSPSCIRLDSLHFIWMYTYRWLTRQIRPFLKSIMFKFLAQTWIKQILYTIPSPKKQSPSIKPSTEEIILLKSWSNVRLGCLSILWGRGDWSYKLVTYMWKENFTHYPSLYLHVADALSDSVTFP